MNSSKNQSWLVPAARIAVVVPLAISTLVLAGGLPSPPDRPRFFVGLIVLTLLLTSTCLVGWHLLAREIETSVSNSGDSYLTVAARQTLADVLSLGVIAAVIAGSWDQIWHSKYPTPFGQDFFWRPHLLLYFGMGVLGLVGLWSWIEVVVKPGSLQQRFRAEPLLGAAALLGTYAIYAISADPIWHAIYGRDLQTWSLPHLLGALLHFLMAVVAIAFHKSLLGRRTIQQWQPISMLRSRHVLIAVVMASALVIMTLLLTLEWSDAVNNVNGQIILLRRPQWLLGGFLGALAGLYGGTALYAAKIHGIATGVGLLAIGFRLLLDNALDGTSQYLPILWLLLVLLIAIDVCFLLFTSLAKSAPPSWVVGGAVGLATLATDQFLLDRLLPFMTNDWDAILSRSAASALAATACIGLARLLNSATDTTAQRSLSGETLRHPLLTLGIYLGPLALAAILISTATAPVS